MKLLFVIICMQLGMLPLFAQKSYFKIGFDYAFVDKEKDVRQNRSTVFYHNKTESILIFPSISYIHKNNWDISLQRQYFHQEFSYVDNEMMNAKRYIRSFDLMFSKNIKNYFKLPSNQFFHNSNLWVGVGVKYITDGGYYKETLNPDYIICYGGYYAYTSVFNPTFNLNYSYEFSKWLQLRVLAQQTFIKDHSNIFMAQIGLGFKI